jgi:hypothetical protein
MVNAVATSRNGQTKAILIAVWSHRLLGRPKLDVQAIVRQAQSSMLAVATASARVAPQCQLAQAPSIPTSLRS